MLTGREYIQKLYSELDENDSVSELLNRAFCEGYEYAQREFARRDYEGLDEAQKEILKRRRSEYAKDLNRSRNQFTLNKTKKLLEDNGWTGVETNGTIKGGGVVSTIKVIDDASNLDNFDTLSKRHVNNIRKYQLESANDAKKIMRENVLKDADGEVSKLRDQLKYDSARNRKDNIRPEPFKGGEVRPGTELVISENRSTKTKGKGFAKSNENLAKTVEESVGSSGKFSKLSEFLKKNKKALKIGGTAALGATALGTGIYLYNKNKKKEESK